MDPAIKRAPRQSSAGHPRLASRPLAIRASPVVRWPSADAGRCSQQSAYSSVSLSDPLNLCPAHMRCLPPPQTRAAAGPHSPAMHNH
eukprot:366566-Chlamydomonas_euryale.AAC.2